jgi:hypothetical protein
MEGSAEALVLHSVAGQVDQHGSDGEAVTCVQRDGSLDKRPESLRVIGIHNNDAP